MYDLQAQKLQKLSGILGYDKHKNLNKFYASKSKYYAFTTKEGEILMMGQDSKKLLFDLKMNGNC